MAALGGETMIKSEYKSVISKIEVDATRVLDFAMGKTAAYFIKTPKS